MNDEQLLRYSRHILLQDFDIDGQQRLLDARVLIVGAGGLGCAAALYLAASGVGRLVLADDDVVESSNLQRQIAHGTADIGQPKVLSLAASLRAINPTVVVEPLSVRLQGAQLDAEVARVELVLDCSDNFATRLAVNAACVRHGVPLVSGAAIRHEGQVAVFNASPGSACYACLYGTAGGDDNLTCSESGVLAPLVGVIGSLQATEALKILAHYGEPLDGRLLLCDARSMEWRSLRLARDPACPVCGIAAGGQA